METEPTKKDLLKKINELKGHLGDLKSELKTTEEKIEEEKTKKQEAEKEEEGLIAKLKDSEAPEVVDEVSATVEPEDKKSRKPRARKADSISWEPGSAKASAKKKSKTYDNLVSSWIDAETQERKEGGTTTLHSPEPAQALDLEPKIINLKEEEIELEPKSRVEQIADKLASYDTKNISDEDAAFYKANTKEIEKLLTGEKMREGEAIRKERERLERENTKKNLLDAMKKGKEFGISAINKTKSAFEMFGRGGGALTGMSKDMEPEGIYPERSDAIPEPTTPKTPEQAETEFELTRRLYLEYTTGSAKFKKESELFKQHAEEKGKAYHEAKKAIYQQMINEGKTVEANNFIAKEVDLRREHEIKHGSLWTKLKGGASQKIEAWDKWGVDKEDATWNEKLGNWNKRVFKRAINIAFIAITSSAAVAGLASQGIGSATALAGGTFSRLGAKLGWGVTLGTVMEYAMTKIPKGADAEKSARVLKKVMIGAGALGAGYLLFTGIGLVGLGVGASALGGHLVSKWVEKKGWTEKGIQEKKEEAKSKFDVNNLDKLQSYEEEYLNTLKQAENSRIYRKMTGTLLSIISSGMSLEMMGLTKDHGEEIKQVYGDKFDAFKRGLKKLGGMISSWLSKDDSEKIIEEPATDEAPKPSNTPDGKQKLKITPRDPEIITDGEDKEDNSAQDEKEGKEEKKTEKTERKERDDNNNDNKKKDYSKVRKSYLGSSNPSKGGHGAWGPESDMKAGYTEVKAVRSEPYLNGNGQHLGYKDHTPYGNTPDNYESREQIEERSERNYDRGGARISTEEMTDKVYSSNLTKILNTPESQKVWEILHSESSGTDAIPFLEIDRNDLGSVQIKNLQDYILKVMDETKLKPKEGESIENFLSRAFDKASSRPKMLEDLIIK